MAPYNFSTPQHLVNLIHQYHSKGFGKPHTTNFGVLLSVHAGVMTEALRM